MRHGLEMQRNSSETTGNAKEKQGEVRIGNAWKWQRVELLRHDMPWNWDEKNCFAREKRRRAGQWKSMEIKCAAMERNGSERSRAARA